MGEWSINYFVTPNLSWGWVGLWQYLKDGLQVVQNTAARCVTGLVWNTSVTVSLQHCGWLSVRQLIQFHSMVLVFKIKQEGKPRYLHEKLSISFNYETRLSKTNAIRKLEKIGCDYRKQSFIPLYRSVEQVNGQIQTSVRVESLQAWAEKLDQKECEPSLKLTSLSHIVSSIVKKVL